LRIIEVESYDWAACGGVHVASTGEIGLVKAVGQERIRGRVRVHVMMGQRALDDYGRKIALAQALSRELTCGEADILGRVQDMQTAARENTRELHRLQVNQAKADADAAMAGAQPLGAALSVRRIFEAAGADYLKAFAERVIATPERVVLAVDRSEDGFQWIVAHSLSRSLDLSTFIPGLLATAAAKGGGRGARMQGVGADREAIPGFLDAIEGELRGRL
jgi:alanyl-tRNA synthetase